MLSSSFSSSSHSVNDYGRRKEQDSLLRLQRQPAGTADETPILQSDNVVQHSAKDTGSESEVEIWSFDRVINEVFRLLPQELCPKSTEEHTPAKPCQELST